MVEFCPQNWIPIAPTPKPHYGHCPRYFYVWNWRTPSIHKGGVKSPATAIIEAEC